jgi:TPR repeat protein
MQLVSFSLLNNLHSLIKQGMTILIQNSIYKMKLEECFKLFLQCADQFKDSQAFWRVSACCFRAIGTERDIEKSFEYDRKAKKQGLTEGIYWFLSYFASFINIISIYRFNY